MKQISLGRIWKCQGATSDRGAKGDWPGSSPYMPFYDYPVPGTIQEALFFLTGDVHLAHNVYQARFIEEQFWHCTRSFSLTEDDLSSGDRIRLVFEGLDLEAVIYVNGREVGRHNNFYLPCRIDITNTVKIGENKLDVVLESGIFANAEKEMDKLYANENGKLFRRAYMRKPQSAFEWDWAPRLLNVGIYKPCRLEISPFFVDEVSVFHDLAKDYSSAVIRIRQFLTLPGKHSGSVTAEIEETGDTVTEVFFGSGTPFVPLTLTLRNPKLWQPRNHGEPYRYTLILTVRDNDTGAVVSVSRKKIGLRRVEIDQSHRPEGGRYFRLIINGQRLFAKGGNMIPADILFSRLDRGTYETLISRALEDNFNALRVWGGGIYETDDFYDLCDENGIVVWQDFVGACATYPSFDRAFFSNYEQEITYEIRRLSMYASLVLYAGNNELNQFVDAVGTPFFSDASLYYYRIPAALQAEGDNHYYQPSSPYSPDGLPATDFRVGDQHPWSIGFSNREYFGYRDMDCRFPNEGGILGPTSLPNMMACLGEGQQFMHSFDFKVHDNAIADYSANAPELYLKERFGMEIDIHGISIPDYVYYGGFCQGEGLTEYILNFRRRMSDTTSSAIFWMYNDCWPETRPWTTVDYLRHRTPSFWPVKRSFAPIAVNLVKRADGGLDVYGINDYLTKKAGN